MRAVLVVRYTGPFVDWSREELESKRSANQNDDFVLDVPWKKQKFRKGMFTTSNFWVCKIIEKIANDLGRFL